MTDRRDRHRRQYWRRHSRDGWACPRCGRPADTVDGVEVHHRDGNAANGDPDNLVALCRQCHRRGEHDRDGHGARRPPSVRSTSPRGIRRKSP